LYNICKDSTILVEMDPLTISAQQSKKTKVKSSNFKKINFKGIKEEENR